MLRKWFLTPILILLLIPITNAWNIQEGQPLSLVRHINLSSYQQADFAGGIAWNGTYFFVADSDGSSIENIMVFDENFNFIRRFNLTLQNRGPMEITTVGKDIWVIDYDKNTLKEVNESGGVDDEFGTCSFYSIHRNCNIISGIFTFDNNFFWITDYDGTINTVNRSAPSSTWIRGGHFYGYDINGIISNSTHFLLTIGASKLTLLDSSYFETDSWEAGNWTTGTVWGLTEHNGNIVIIDYKYQVFEFGLPLPTPPTPCQIFDCSVYPPQTLFVPLQICHFVNWVLCNPFIMFLGLILLVGLFILSKVTGVFKKDTSF